MRRRPGVLHACSRRVVVDSIAPGRRRQPTERSDARGLLPLRPTALRRRTGGQPDPRHRTRRLQSRPRRHAVDLDHRSRTPVIIKRLLEWRPEPASQQDARIRRLRASIKKCAPSLSLVLPQPLIGRRARARRSPPPQRPAAMPSPSSSQQPGLHRRVPASASRTCLLALRAAARRCRAPAGRSTPGSTSSSSPRESARSSARPFRP